MSKAPAKRTPAKTPMRVPKHGGGKLKIGGNNGGGRPPDEFKRRMAELASSDEALKYLGECVKGKHGPQAALKAQQYVADRGYGKVPTTIQGGDKPLRLLVVTEPDGLEGAA